MKVSSMWDGVVQKLAQAMTVSRVRQAALGYQGGRRG